MGFQETLIVVGTVLAAAIRMMNEPWLRSTHGDGAAQGGERQVLLQSVTDGPTDDAPGEEIQNDGEINCSNSDPI